MEKGINNKGDDIKTTKRKGSENMKLLWHELTMNPRKKLMSK